MKKIFLAMAVAIVTVTAVSAQKDDSDSKITVSIHQTDQKDGYEGSAEQRCGIRFNLPMAGVVKIEVESVDGLPLAGTAITRQDAFGKTVVGDMAHTSTIITYISSEKSGFIPGKDYYISTLPCNLYGGYRFSIYKDGLVAHYFGVHQKVELGEFISPDDLVESELEFDKPGAPLVEKGRPKMDSKTHKLFVLYRKNPTEANRQALLDQMGVRYDKVVARKKNKLRELEREARTYSIVEHMQGIVNEMVENRETRIRQQFLRFIDPRRDDNPKDAWMVLRGASDATAYIGYAPVTNAEYAAFKPGFTYKSGQDNYPVVNISLQDAQAYCQWLTVQDSKHIYRLPSEEEWILGAGHMPKDVAMNANHVESGLTAVDAYKQSTGACGGIDFWGNCWEWTTSTDVDGQYLVKGGSWDAKRDDCRSEKSDDVRSGNKGYANVGFRVVRTDTPQSK
ncbi:formylglycine-generating enzyme family protein [Bacteroides fragilis]|uniref:Formylglycine-generating enzyme family protein n=1 Tax=Bacteroides fragilis TaxID=817 RepID=A0A5M5PR10_BACFG|nr:formylglycine-generating enzyme family protein [Bacteroides fragilis]KAA4708104.1 formylglycine-generating enzyme family protein [Bacteroides fragilis]KAA4720068.1 formylglycine-generating enzyme family protein [Bacteroides fragilis]KAA4731539.1 formylglycine-generating enzyme family protein [Bacteroides fragilis]KAA4732279.1 formylglycine-generating enzyme family protein [Bacteroides fragilis]